MIENRIAQTGRKPKAIIPVHLYGMPAMMDEIMVIANEYEIPVLEDAATAGIADLLHGAAVLPDTDHRAFSGDGVVDIRDPAVSFDGPLHD